LYGGYQFTPHWGAEVGYHDFGRQRWGVAVGGAVQTIAERETTAWSLVGTGTFPVMPGLSLFGKLGLYNSDTDVRGWWVFLPAADRPTKPEGVGGRFDFGRNLSMRIEWERVNNTGSNTTGTTDMDMLSISAMFRF
jgi:OOP family OmpA-OmpF porin